MKFKSPYLVKPHSKVRLSHLSTHTHEGFASEQTAAPVLVKETARLSDLQEVLYASQKNSVLIVLQGMDTAGKDGTIRHIFSGVNPQGCNVASFKVPTPLEARHDFLWRCHQQAPASGMIEIFNRSHYEDVLWPRVHSGMGAKEARQHLDEINDWESMLAANGTLVLKFFLHISQKEQTQRLQSRIDEKDKNWKLNPADFAERIFWSKYMQAYEEILEHTSRKHAPWFVIPADHKWYRDIVISQILAGALQDLKLKYPPPTFDAKGLQLSELSVQEANEKIKALVSAADPEAPAKASKKS